MCYLFQGSEPAHIRSHSDYLKQHYRCTRFTSDQEEWPPNQPKYFTSLALIHYKSGRTEREVITFTKSIQNTHVDDTVFSTCSQNTLLEQSQDQFEVTKDIKKMFAPDKDDDVPRSVLIEGAPRIGKTVLSKEIALQWAKGQLLNKIILV